MRVKRKLAEQVHLKRNGKFWSVAQVFFDKLNKLRNPKHPLIKLDSQNGGSREWSLGGERERAMCIVREMACTGVYWVWSGWAKGRQWVASVLGNSYNVYNCGRINLAVSCTHQYYGEKSSDLFSELVNLASQV